MTGFFLQLYLLHFFLSLSSKGECVLTLWDLQFQHDSIPVLLGVGGRNLLCVGRRMDYWMLYNTLWPAKFTVVPVFISDLSGWRIFTECICIDRISVPKRCLNWSMYLLIYQDFISVKVSNYIYIASGVVYINVL